MICAFTAAGILNQNQKVFLPSLEGRPSLARYFGRLQSTVTRRLWAERAAVPVCSRYAQSLVELLTSVNRSVKGVIDLPKEFSQLWGSIQVDAATPIPFISMTDGQSENWESAEGWVSSDSGWEVWTGVVEVKPINWKIPSRSTVRSLMDGGDGPPMVGKGSTVMRGVNWDQPGNEYCNDDGKNMYDTEKINREKEKCITEESLQSDDINVLDNNANSSESTRNLNATVTPDPADESESAGILNVHSDSAEEVRQRDNESISAMQPVDLSSEGKKSKKLPSPRLPIGTVVSIEPWNGIPGMARRVKWHLTGKEGIYRYGGDGGMYDLCHVEVNSKETKVKKRYPLPESSEQCAARHGFGVKSFYGIILRIRSSGKERKIGNEVEYQHDGILEWPDFGAGVRVKCVRHACGTLSIEENELLFGSKDSGWIPRFGEPSYVPGSRFLLSSKKNEASKSTNKAFLYEELSGSSDFNVKLLRNPANGSPMKVSSVMRLCRGLPTNTSANCELSQTITPLPPPITFDRSYCAPSLTLSRDNRTISCTSSDSGRGTVFGALGFTKGVHYWEVKLEQADIGSVFIGVAEKPVGSGSGSSYLFDTPPRLNRWHGWGFVNFRATYTAGAERVFGSHCHAGDTVGVMLDCDAGRVSFFFDGLKYGEHILNDLGCAFENLSPFGFNVDGCGSGGAGQGAPSGFENGANNRFPAQGTIRPRTLWPVIGLRNHGDRVTISSKWLTSFGTDGVVSTRNIVKVDEILTAYFDTIPRAFVDPAFPRWFVSEAFSEYNRWISDSWIRSSTRGSGPSRDTGICLDVDFDASPLACAAACATLGLHEALLTGDRVKLTRSAGRILQLAEEAVVLGVYHGRLYYRILLQKSEGGSLTEGGGRAWCWDESEVVEGLPFVLPSKGRGVPLPPLARFCCNTSLKVVYESGAVLRSDLEIFDGSETVGTIPFGTIIPNSTILDRRINSCGGVRFRICSDSLGEGWISERIRGGSEELIVEYIDDVDDSGTSDQKKCYETPLECATVWFDSWKDCSNDKTDHFVSSLSVVSYEQFTDLISHGIISGLTAVESDSILTSLMNAISNYSVNGDAVEVSFQEVVASVAYAHTTVTGLKNENKTVANAAANQAAAAILAKFSSLPTLQAMLTRIALLRSFNRRARLAMPWLSIRPCQEGSAILGGLHGHGTSPDRSGRCQSSAQSELWVQVPSIATKIRSLRGIFFTSVKRSFIQSVVDATTTSTSLSHDEYELPREIRTVRINRLKAARAMLGDDVSAKRKYSVFSQLQSETKSWSGASLRRGFIAKGHGGQKRAFKVKLIGEGVNDYSGPYREAFTDAMADVLKIEPNSSCSLAVLDPTPNNASSIGENRDLFMFSLNGRNLTSMDATKHSCYSSEQRIRHTFASLMIGSDESSREVEESLGFLGRLVGTAFRHGIPLDIPLPLYTVWKALVEEPVKSSQKLLELDHFAHKQLSLEDDANDSILLAWQQRMLNAFTEGLGNVIPVEILPLLSGEELREMMCGNPNVDVDLLKHVVEYEGYVPTDDVITYFWSTLNEMTNEERKQFLQFVWARNRLPMRESDFDAPFKIQKDTSKGEQALPSASTCFFTLTLPEYTNQDVLREKLLFAIRNVTTMETDFQTNSAEIAEGYRSF
jgi:HECT-domain (ubiquitin-transferase)/SPRY domain